MTAGAGHDRTTMPSRAQLYVVVAGAAGLLQLIEQPATAAVGTTDVPDEQR